MRSTALRRTSIALVAAAILVFTAACGSDSGSESSPGSASESSASPSGATSKPADAGGPDCATIWVKGEQLDRGYRGCTQDGATVAVEKIGCSSGQTFVLFEDQFWAVKGGVIKYAPDGLTSSDAYREDMAACRG